MKKKRSKDKSNEWLDSSTKINIDTIKLLTNNQSFITRIESLRKKFKIPKLSQATDKIIDEGAQDSFSVKTRPLLDSQGKDFGPNHFSVDPCSKWLDSIPMTKITKLENELLSILQEFNLSTAEEWQSWLIYYVLYQNENLYLPEYNFDSTTLSTGTGLTTGEKNTLKRIAKIDKRELKKDKPLLKLFDKESKKSLKTKNKLRSLKNIDKAVKGFGLKKGKDDSQEYDYALGKPHSPKTDRDLIPKMWDDPNDDISEEADDKRYPNLRKIKERFKKAQIKRFGK